MRKLLKYLEEIKSQWNAWLDGMIHPAGLTDHFSKKAHRRVLAKCLLTGAAGLFLLPLHLAFAGPLGLPTLIVLAWMLCHWPLAAGLSRTGNLDQAILVSALLIVGLAGSAALLTGGLFSGVVLWLMIGPLEAAFASGRKVPVATTVVAGLSFAGLVVGAESMPAQEVLSGQVSILIGLGALSYGGLLCIRLSSDRRHLNQNVQTAVHQKRKLSQMAQDVLCEISADGASVVLGGPVCELIGLEQSEVQRDWIFERLHVGDRPTYLANLSDVRMQGTEIEQAIRLRIGKQAPGEPGIARFEDMHLTLRPSPAPNGIKPSAPMSVLARISSENRSLMNAAKNANETLSGLVSIDRLVHRFSPSVLPADNDSNNPIGNSSDISGVLAECREVLLPSAIRKGVELEINDCFGPKIASASIQPLRDCVLAIASDMIKNASGFALVEINCRQDAGDVSITATFNSRGLEDAWTLSGATGLIRSIRDQIEDAGGKLVTYTALGDGESVVFQFANIAGGQASDLPPFGAAPLKQSA